MKSVQLPLELFQDIALYFLGPDEYADDEDLLRGIEQGLKEKLDAMLKHDLYSRSKDSSLTPEQREAARQEYLDAVGMRASYRWSQDNNPFLDDRETRA